MENERISILYLHGYGSKYKPESEKVIALQEIGDVVGVNLDYSKGPNENIDRAGAVLLDNHNIELIVGTSMGGWLASQAGSKYGIPFVALNPATKPSITLVKYIGQIISLAHRQNTSGASTLTSGATC